MCDKIKIVPVLKDGVEFSEPVANAERLQWHVRKTLGDWTKRRGWTDKRLLSLPPTKLDNGRDKSFRRDPSAPHNWDVT